MSQVGVWLTPSPCLRRNSESPLAPLKLSLSLKLSSGRLGEPRDPSMLARHREARLARSICPSQVLHSVVVVMAGPHPGAESITTGTKIGGDSEAESDAQWMRKARCGH